jgi:hypothetical protein
VVVDTAHFELGIECIVELGVAAGSLVLHIVGLAVVDYMLLGMLSSAVDQLEEGCFERRFVLRNRSLGLEEVDNLLAVVVDTGRLESWDTDPCLCVKQFERIYFKFCNLLRGVILDKRFKIRLLMIE